MQEPQTIPANIIQELTNCHTQHEFMVKLLLIIAFIIAYDLYYNTAYASQHILSL